LRLRPSEEMASRIEAAFVQAGYDFNAQEAWPETFHGFDRAINNVQVKDVSALEMEAAVGFTEMLQLSEPHDEAALADIASKVEALPEREKIIVRQRFGFDGPPKSRQELADELGVTKVRIDQLKNRGLRRIAAKLHTDELAEEMKGNLCIHGIIKSLLCPECVKMDAFLNRKTVEV